MPDASGWVVLFGLLTTWPGILALTLRLVVEGARNDGAPFAPRCPVSCGRLRLP